MNTIRLAVFAGLLLAALTLIPAYAHAVPNGRARAAADPLSPLIPSKPTRGQAPRALAAAMKAWGTARLGKAGVRTRQVATAAAVAPKPCSDTTAVPDASNLEAVRASVLCLVNEQRAAHDLTPLVDNRQLETAAQRHSDDMVARDYFGHWTLEGVDIDTRIFATGYADEKDSSSYELLAENIAWGTESQATPVRIVESWMASPSHRANVLHPTLRESGIGITLGAPKGVPGRAATFTHDFGAR